MTGIALLIWTGSKVSAALRAESKLKICPARMLREALAGRAGMTASGDTFQTYLSRLRINSLVVDTEQGRRTGPDLMGGLDVRPHHTPT